MQWTEEVYVFPHGTERLIAFFSAIHYVIDFSVAPPLVYISPI